MKCYVFLVILFYLELSSLQVSGKWYTSYVNLLRDIVKNGYLSMNIPKLDPLLFNRTLIFEDNLNSINLHLEGMLCNHSDFYVNNLDIKPDLNTTLELQFNAVNFIASYNLEGQAIKAIPLQGNGNIELYGGNLVFLIESKIHGHNRTIQITDFKLNYNVGVSRTVLSGFLQRYRLDSIIEHFLSDLIPSGINILRQQIQDLLNQLSLEYGNVWLQEMDLKHIIDSIKTF